jgi:hypothetical protein
MNGQPWSTSLDAWSERSPAAAIHALTQARRHGWYFRPHARAGFVQLRCGLRPGEHCDASVPDGTGPGVGSDYGWAAVIHNLIRTCPHRDVRSLSTPEYAEYLLIGAEFLLNAIEDGLPRAPGQPPRPARRVVAHERLQDLFVQAISQVQEAEALLPQPLMPRPGPPSTTADRSLDPVALPVGGGGTVATDGDAPAAVEEAERIVRDVPILGSTVTWLRARIAIDRAQIPTL